MITSKIVYLSSIENNTITKKPYKRLLLTFAVLLLIGFIIGMVFVILNKYDSNYNHTTTHVNNFTFNRYVEHGLKLERRIYAEYYLSTNATQYNITCFTFTEDIYNINDEVDTYISKNNKTCILFDKPIAENYYAGITGVCILLILSIGLGLSVCFI